MANEFIARTGLIVLQSGIKVTGSSAVLGDITASGDIAATNFRGSGQFLTDVAAASVQYTNVLNKPTLVSSSTQFNTLTQPFTGSFTGSFKGDGSQLTGLATSLRISGSTGTDAVSLLSEDLTFAGSNGVTAAVTNNTVTIGIPAGTVSGSSQVDVRNTTGIATIATTGSNTFTGVQTISNTTNSTNYTDGALIVQGGVGITKDVNISGSLTVTGLLTAVSTSIQYVTSSQLNVGLSRITLNNDDLIRFSGLSVIDSGSTFGTGSFLWDSLNNRWIIEADDANYESAVSITGPKHLGTLGDEPGLVDNRVPVAFADHHIDSRIASSSIRVDFPSRLTHVEAGLYVTGAISSSVGFSGDGSNLTGVVSTLSVTGSQGGQGAVNLKTQGLTVTGTNGIATTVSGQTLTIANPYFTTASVYSATGPTTNEVVLSLPTGSHDAAQFDYVLKDGTNYRTGTVMAVWNGTTGFEFTDTSTADIGNTGQAQLSVDTFGGNVRLQLTLTSGTWTAKTAIRML